MTYVEWRDFYKNYKIPGNFGTYKIQDNPYLNIPAYIPIRDFDLQTILIVLKNKLYYQDNGLEVLFRGINEKLITPNEIYEKADDDLFVLLYKKYKYKWLLPDILRNDKAFIYALENL